MLRVKTKDFTSCVYHNYIHTLNAFLNLTLMVVSAILAYVLYNNTNALKFYKYNYMYNRV